MIGKNNIYNIRSTSSKLKWKGSCGSTRGFVDFCSFDDCLRAALIILKTYQQKYNLTRLDSMIERWAPSSENDTKAYVRYISDNIPDCSGLDRVPNIQFHVFDAREYDYEKLEWLLGLLRSMARMETGYNLSYEMFMRVVDSVNKFRGSNVRNRA